VWSYDHFVGPVEQTYRLQQGSQVENKTNIEAISVFYQITDRLSANAVLPFLSASRRSNSAYATFHTSGVADSNVGLNCWLFNPKTVKTGNVSLGAGLLLPTGKDNQQNNSQLVYGGPQVLVTPDYSIQTGQGSWGMVMGWQAFKDLGNQFTAFTDGSYVMTQGGTDGVIRMTGATAPAPTSALTQYNAIQDQYMIEIGGAHPVPKIRGMTWTLSVRDEGVPARNILGNNLGFRRPGFGIALTPGFIYTRGTSMLQFSVGKAIFRDRTLSVPDMILGGHGDAAFANWIWMGSYTLRLPKKHGEEEATNRGTSPRPNALVADTAAGRTGTFKPFKLKTLDGTDKTLGDFSNKVTLVSFFFPKCPSCNAELPEEQKIYDKYKDKGLSMVWINILPDEEELVAGWEIKRHLTVPVLVGASQDSLERDYHVTATPTNYLLDEKGEVLFRQNGYKLGDEKNLEARIAAALNIAP
jgi:thiol-disulfide isomerase/thioredoxin